ncbi:hypothetical protein THAOC_10144 [Thalassiosira oceanica]|uniref:Uncharacterized protein n=1 Tax=Thalassiosira oceanica TaxID=159749 RepID=K0T5T9_THAOC|nr:hypothetical protein THAOC_10144 [Thalassiosira oceanica]|eukprot:EJK68656.1 hypothetical protein THAOC_10144 [Thalassiosira oceanica]
MSSSNDTAGFGLIPTLFATVQYHQCADLLTNREGNAQFEMELTRLNVCRRIAWYLGGIDLFPNPAAAYPWPASTICLKPNKHVLDLIEIEQDIEVESTVEDRRNIILDLKWPAGFDGATPE